MKYRINGHILFDANAGSLNLKDFSDDPLPISNPSKRLLLLLIAHRGEPVSREVIFRKVWDEYGMISSNNNLNQCVSKLRRVLKMLGIDEEVIITVPKVGFMLSQDIAIENEDQAPQMPLETRKSFTSPSSSMSASGVRLNRTQPARRAGRRWGMFCGVLALTVVLVAGGALFVTGFGEQEERFIGETSSCKIFVLAPSQTIAASSALNRDILAYADNQPARCNREEYLLVVRSNQIRSYISGISRLFLMKCRILQEHHIEMCYGLQDEQLP
ncbi:transcriptional regulator [Serratia sp. NPDC078593]|uniref:winged helix-turn-helix domain-containing protein n=1 Tax=unclassified Serratia (in: enterobacteria) TaxID=2647522 RepID=UPI0037CEE3BE